MIESMSISDICTIVETGAFVLLIFGLLVCLLFCAIECYCVSKAKSRLFNARAKLLEQQNETNA